MNKDKYIIEGKINYIIAKPSNGRTQFLKILMDEYQEGILVNLKDNNLQDINENIEIVNDTKDLTEMDFKNHKVIFLNNATILGHYNENPRRVYLILKEINRKYKKTIICVESYITFLDNKNEMLRSSDNILQLNRNYFYTKNEEDRLKINIEKHSDMSNYDKYTEDVIQFDDEEENE